MFFVTFPESIPDESKISNLQKRNHKGPVNINKKKALVHNFTGTRGNVN